VRLSKLLVVFSTIILYGSIVTLAFAQATVNPDISFIGDFQTSLQDQKETVDKGKPVVDFKELEIGGAGPLNPYVRGDINLSVSQSGIDIEEAYMTVLRGLPLGLQLKAGKYLVDVGKLNTQHSHQWAWIERPLFHKELFGEEGLKDIGFNLNMLQPLGEGSIGISANWLKNGGLISDSEATSPYAPNRVNMAGSGRVSLFYPTSDYSNLETGVSVLHSQIQPTRIYFESSYIPSNPTDEAMANFVPDKRYATVGAIDLKWKYKPDNYNGFQIIGEYMTQSRTNQIVSAIVHPAGDTTFNSTNKSIKSYGLFGLAEIRWARRWDAGVLYDYAQGIENANTNMSGYGAYAAFSVAEETTRFGLLYRRNSATGIDSYNSVTLQILWMLGPHKPHTF